MRILKKTLRRDIAISGGAVWHRNADWIVRNYVLEVMVIDRKALIYRYRERSFGPASGSWRCAGVVGSGGRVEALKKARPETEGAKKSGTDRLSWPADISTPRW